MSLPCDIKYRDQRSSSGRIARGRIVLTISQRASPHTQQEHVTYLRRALESRAARLLALPVPSTGGSGRVNSASDLSRLAEDLNQRHYGFAFTRAVFGRQGSRWGSCSVVTRTIRISHRLQGAPTQLVAYVLIHELCHLAVPNHGADFWRLVARACPEHRLRRRQLDAWDLRVHLGLVDD